jgi:circadian clock protein KaiB
MKSSRRKESRPSESKEVEARLERTRRPTLVLRLYVAGMTPRSSRAVQAVREFCDEYLDDKYDLEVVDIYRHPEQAREQQVVAAPTLVKSLPLPLRRLIGDMSSKDRILLSLDLKLPYAKPKRQRRTQ